MLPLIAVGLHRLWRNLDRNTRCRRELTLFLGLAVISTLMRAAASHFMPGRYDVIDPLPTTFAWFCAGLALAVLSVDQSPSSVRLRAHLRAHPWRPWAAALAVWVVTLAIKDYQLSSVIVFIEFGVMGTLIVAPLVLGAPYEFSGGRFLVWRPVAFLGLISYATYLYHYPLMMQLHPNLGSGTANLVVMFVAGTVIGVTCGALSYYLVERHALRFKNVGRFSHRPARS